MTHDEVMALSDEELQIMATELRGWRYRIVNVWNFPDLSQYTDEPFGYLITSPNGEAWGGSLDVDERIAKSVYYPDYNDIATAMDLALSIGDRYWMEFHTPFRVGDPSFAGFTPLGTSGWNGRPDNQCGAEKPAKAITRAYVLVMTQEE